MISNLKLAYASIKSAKWRSLFTILGITIGVACVVTILSLGEGLRRQVVVQINQFGPDLITVRPGKPLVKDRSGHITNLNFFAGLGTSTLTEADVEAARKAPGVKTAVPISLLNTSVSVDEHNQSSTLVIGASGDVPAVLNQKLAYGTFFDGSDKDKPLMVVGKTVAEQLFKENIPIGKVATIYGERFVVVGVLNQFTSSPLVPGSDLNNSIIVPFGAIKRLSGGNGQIVQLLVKPTNPKEVDQVTRALQTTLSTAHAGQDDFTILNIADNVALNNTLLNTVTTFIAAVAGVSLFVAGVGIMNIMLVAVTERTHEIGIRKAVGATRRQILGQFMSEAIMLSLLGGLAGLACSFVAVYLLRLFTELEPFITWIVAVSALGISVLIGLIFGSLPAFQAARKHPIEALRQH